MRYWSQFINHEIRAIKGIKWYISNILVRCGCIASIDEVAKCNNYVDIEAIRIFSRATKTRNIAPLLLRTMKVMAT